MRTINFLFFATLLFTSQAVHAYGIGQSTYPLMEKQKLISAEMTGITSTGGGVGIQGRYTHKLSKQVILDGGAGFSGGERGNRIFVGGDFEIFPDYGTQPRVSVKTSFENSDDFDYRRNTISIAPTVSKGFSFWGKEAYPFVALPFGIQLTDEYKGYETVMNLNLGMTGNVPVEGYENLTASAEFQVDIKDSFTAIFLGLSYPLK